MEIGEILTVDWSPPALTLEVYCSPGTYIRSLAHDLGQRLGTGAHLAALIRLSSGRFRLEDSVSLSRLEEAFAYRQEADYLLPVDEALLDLPALVVAAGDARRLIQGRPSAPSLWQLLPTTLDCVACTRLMASWWGSSPISL